MGIFVFDVVDGRLRQMLGKCQGTDLVLPGRAPLLNTGKEPPSRSTAGE